MKLKKIVDLVIPNITKILQNHKNEKLKLHMIKKLTEFKKKKKLEKLSSNNMNLSSNVVKLFNLLESEDEIKNKSHA